MTGDFTALFKAFIKLKSPPPQHLTAQEMFFEILDTFDGPFHIIEQSISGDVKATYKKIKPFMKWIYVNMENQYQSRPDSDSDYDYYGDYEDYEGYEWSTYG